MVIKTPDSKIWILEFKHKRSAIEALNQIIDKRYFENVKNLSEVIIMGINCKNYNITEIKYAPLIVDNMIISKQQIDLLHNFAY